MRVVVVGDLARAMAAGRVGRGRGAEFDNLCAVLLDRLLF